MKTLLELKDEIRQLAEDGMAAATARNLKRCIEVRRQLEPLMRELGDRLADDSWTELADRGIELEARCRKWEEAHERNAQNA